MKSLCKLMVLGTVALAATPAAATVYSGSYDVTLNGSDPGLILNWAPIAPGLNFDLSTPGQSTTFSLFQLWTDETAVNPDDLVGKPISVAFNFTLPGVVGGSVTGTTAGDSVLFGLFQDGHVTWNNGGDVLLDFGAGGLVNAHLDDATFNWGIGGLNDGYKAGAPIQATFTLERGAVPEPATWAMMILGMGMVGAGMRLRRRQAVPSAA